MRHTRNRQMFKLTGHNFWKDTYNLPIEVTRKWNPRVDPSFKWFRNWRGASNVNILQWENTLKFCPISLHKNKGDVII